MGKLKGRFVRSRHCFARMKTHIQPSLLTDLHLCRMVFHPASCSWGAACELNKCHQARALPSLTTGEQDWVRDQNRKGQILGATKQPRSYLVKTEMSTLSRNRSAIVSTSSQPASPSNGPTMATQDQALPVSHMPPKVSNLVPENLPAEPSTPATCRSTTAVSTQGGHPNTENSATEHVTRSGGVVKPPHG